MQGFEMAPWRPSAPRPHADRPLSGVTILLVEDSIYVSDAVRLMSIRSGARLRRADCLQSALKHIRMYRPDVVLLDLGLPDGSGITLLAELQRLSDPPPIIVISGDDSAAAQALDAGALHFIAKPFFDLAAFQHVLLSVLPEYPKHFGFSPRVVGKELHLDDDSLREDFDRLRDIMRKVLYDDQSEELPYGVQFLCSLAQTVQDDRLSEFATALSRINYDDAILHKTISQLLDFLETRLAA